MAQYAYVVARNTRAGIQVEIDKAHAEGGGLVFLPRGRYRLDGPLRLTLNVHLTGVGTQTVLEIDPAMGPAAVDVNVIELAGGDEAAPHDIEISKLAIRGPGMQPDITAGVSSDFRKGCGIIAAQTEVRHVVVRACRIENTSGCGILFFTQGAHHLMEGITIRDCYLLQNRRPPESGKPDLYKDIFFYGACFEHVCVEGNVCGFAPNASSAYGNDSGVAFVGNGHGGYVRHTRLVGNVCTGHRRHGLITSYGKMEDDGVFVSDNRCENNGWVGLYVNTDGTFTQNGRVVISGNYCCHNGFGDVGEIGKWLAGARNRFGLDPNLPRLVVEAVDHAAIPLDRIGVIGNPGAPRDRKRAEDDGENAERRHPNRAARCLQFRPLHGDSPLPVWAVAPSTRGSIVRCETRRYPL